MVQGLYSWFHLSVLITRVLYLSLTAAKINDEATRIVPFLRSLPSALWNVEVQRFLEHLTQDKVALSGMHFFTITRSLILKVGRPSLQLFPFTAPCTRRYK